MSRTDILLSRFARYASDTLRIVQSPSSWRQKARIWIRLTTLAAGFKGGTILGYQVSRFGDRALYLLYREIFARQCYRFDARTSKPFILDCGANIGMAVLYFKWLYPEAEVWAFEPEPRTFLALQENVARNTLANVSLHNVALGDTDGPQNLFVPDNRPGSIVASLNPARHGGTPVHVRGARLSSFIEREVDFLKLDVEGSELQILSELAETGKIKFIQQMIIEYHHDVPNVPAALSGLLRLLEDAGFTYQVSASSGPFVGRAHSQTILVGASRATAIVIRPAAAQPAPPGTPRTAASR